MVPTFVEGVQVDRRAFFHVRNEIEQFRYVVLGDGLPATDDQTAFGVVVEQMVRRRCERLT